MQRIIWVRYMFLNDRWIINHLSRFARSICEDLHPYIRSAFQIHQATTATRTHITFTINTSSTCKTTRAETAVRFVSVSVSSLIRCHWV